MLCRHAMLSKVKCFAAAVIALLVLDQLGVFHYIRELDYATEFSYPLEIDGKRLLDRLEQGEKPKLEAINSYEQHRFKIRNEQRCLQTTSNLRLVLVVKSALGNRKRRDAIRRSWGFEGRFSDVHIRRVFVVGTGDPATQDAIDAEHTEHSDLVQADFVDAYYNNTIKTMTGFRWVFHHCSAAEFAFFVDDDYYVSMKNLLRFLRNPLGLSPSDDADPRSLVLHGRLFAGYVFPSSRPMRHRFSKWYLSLDEYPFSRFPPYVTAGAFVLSAPALRDMYRISEYTRHFRFDDIYLGIVAKKAGVVPLHSDRFRFWAQGTDLPPGLVASHGFGDPEELVRVWEQQKARGEA